MSEVQSVAGLILIVSASCWCMVNLYPGCCVPQERAPYPLWIGSWLGPGANWGTLEREEYFAPSRNWMPDSPACGNYIIMAPRRILSHPVTIWPREKRRLVETIYSLTCCESVGCLIFSHPLKFISVASEYNRSVSRSIRTLIWQALRVQFLALRPPDPAHYYSTAFLWGVISRSLELGTSILDECLLVYRAKEGWREVLYDYNRDGLFLLLLPVLQTTWLHIPEVNLCGCHYYRLGVKEYIFQVSPTHSWILFPCLLG